jgi:putative pyruvate formate lyase activating enzyme
MVEHNRRFFLKNVWQLVVAGLGTALLSFLIFFKREDDSPLVPVIYAFNRQRSFRKKKAPAIAPGFEPAYLKLHKSGELKKRGQALWNMMVKCNLCPRDCGVNRLEGERGFCRASSQLKIASYHPHFGEERPLVGKGGSGTIFLSHCNLRCAFCINYEINHEGIGSKQSIDDMAGMMLKLQDIGCHNINVVTPTHYSPHILLALDIAAGKGLRLPLVYNTSGYERQEVLRHLDGVVDIYLPDFKYFDGNMSDTYSSGADDYPAITKKALVEMNRQVGVAIPPRDGIMQRGLMIRHLVLPNGVSGFEPMAQWIAAYLPKNTYINIMSQYRPMYKAHNYPKIARKITSKEYNEAVRFAQKAGLTNLDIQGFWF